MTTALGRREGTLQEVAEALRSARRVTALCHENPDADTIGAAVAIAIIAERLGAEAEIVSCDPPAPLFGFLPRIENVRSRPQLEPDVAVVCDAATIERVGRIATEEADWLARSLLVNIDHHVSSDYFGDLNLVDPVASATCEVLVRLVSELGITLDAELATPLLTGIVRDSHGFSDPATSGETLRLAARLVDAGAPLAAIHRSVLAELPYPTMALWGRILGTLSETADGRIIHAVLTRDMLDGVAAEQHDADGVVEFMARSQGAEVTLLLRELGPNETRVSIRTSEGLNASGIAAAFGGGGHTGRAGCTVPSPLAVAVDRVLAVTAERLATKDR